MDGEFSKKMKDHNEQQRKETVQHLKNELRNLRQNYSNLLNRLKDETTNDIQNVQDEIKARTSSLSRWLMWDTLRYSLAVIVGAVLTISVLASIPWATEWWTSPTWHNGVTSYRNEAGTWIRFKPGSIEGTENTEDGSFHVLIKTPKED